MLVICFSYDNDSNQSISSSHELSELNPLVGWFFETEEETFLNLFYHFQNEGLVDEETLLEMFVIKDDKVKHYFHQEKFSKWLVEKQ